MRKTYITLFAAILLTLVGCKKETGEQVTVTFDAQLSQSHAPKDAKGITVYLNDANKPCWTENDAIRVNDGDGTVTNVNTSNASRARFSVTMTDPQDHKYFAVYPASIGHHGQTSYDLHSNPKVYLPRVQEYVEQNGKQVINAPMFAYNQERPTLQFHNLCGMMKITVTNDKAWDMIIDSIQVESTHHKLWGEMDITNPTYPTINSQIQYATLNAPTNVPTDSFQVSSRRLNTVSLSFANLSNNARYIRSTGLESVESSEVRTSATYYLYLPVIATNASHKFYIRVFSHPAWKSSTSDVAPYDAPDAEVHISYEKRTNANAYISRNEIIPVAISLSSSSPTFTSLKAFSVASGTQVSFSRGNAQYYIDSYTDCTLSREMTSSGYWRFSPRQWDFLYTSSLTDNISGNNYRQGMWLEHFTWGSGDNPVRHFNLGSNPVHSYQNFVTWHQDWGVNFTNVTASTVWRSLTQPEIHYLLYTRVSVQNGNFAASNKNNFAWTAITDAVPTNAGGHSSQYGNYLFGIIVMPDFFIMNNPLDSKTLSVLNSGEFKAYANETPWSEQTSEDDPENPGQTIVNGRGDNATRYRNDNEMTKAQFEYYEARGCIFLPCIGAFSGLGAVNDPWYDNQPECSIWTSTTKTRYQSKMLMLSADVPSGVTSTGRADCRSNSDAYNYRRFNVRLVRTYSQGGGNYKYDPFQ